jgi:hypothetical protein
MRPSALQRPVHARGAVQRCRPCEGFSTLDIAKGLIDEGYPPDDGLFPAGGAWRDAGRTDRDREQGARGACCPKAACFMYTDRFASKTGLLRPAMKSLIAT